MHLAFVLFSLNSFVQRDKIAFMAALLFNKKSLILRIYFGGYCKYYNVSMFVV